MFITQLYTAEIKRGLEGSRCLTSTYIQSESVIHTALCRNVLSILEKKTPVNPPKYLRVAETEVLFAMPNIQRKQGRRDLTLLLLLYDIGARAGERIEFKGGNVVFGNCPSIKLFCKGRKTRVVPIMAKTASIHSHILTKQVIHSVHSP